MPEQDNLAPEVDNLSPEAEVGTEGDYTKEVDKEIMTEPTGWKDSLSTDLKNSPLLQKFDDTAEGLEKAFASHDNLEKLLGHEKVPIPKDENDVEGWNRFSKALGIPSKAEGYGLPDANLPESMAEYKDAFNKEQFAEIAHSHKLTPSQAKGLWETYQKMNIDSYTSQMKDYQEKVAGIKNELMGEWGDAYETKVELGQMVINKFAADKDANDYITSSLSQDPRGIKFLAKLGEQFAENKIGEFHAKTFSLAPEQAMEEIEKIIRDPKHPYNDEKSTPKEHQASVDYVNNLYKIANKR